MINKEIPLTFDQVNGDDGVFGTDYLDYEDEDYLIGRVVELISSFGFEANAEKQEVNQLTFHYLQRYFNETILNEHGYIAGSYPTVLALNAGMYPERFHDPSKWSADMETLRWIMILENCEEHPLFHEIIEFFIKGDKYGLGTRDHAFFNRLPYLYEDAKMINDFVPTYNKTYEKRGILDFKTVKYLLSKMNHLRVPFIR